MNILIKVAISIFTVIVFIVGFFTGTIFTHGQYTGLVDKISTGFQNAIQIEKIEIDFNETQIIESLIKFINSSEEKGYSNGPMRLIQ